MWGEGAVHQQCSRSDIQTNDRVRVLGWGCQRRQITLHRDSKASSEGLGELPAVQDGSICSRGWALTVESADAKSRGDRDTTLRLHGVEHEQAWLCQATTVHHSLLLRCLGWRKRKRDDHTLSYAASLAKTAYESIEATGRKRRVLFAGFVARMGEERLPRWVIFGELVGDKGCSGGQEKDRLVHFKGICRPLE